MKNVQKSKRANKSLPFFFKDEFKVSFVIIFVSVVLLITTFTFDIVPPILNRGIQPATFPKALLILIIAMTLIVLSPITRTKLLGQFSMPAMILIFLYGITSFLVFTMA